MGPIPGSSLEKVILPARKKVRDAGVDSGILREDLEQPLMFKEPAVDHQDIFQQFEAVLMDKLGASYDDYAFPPPVFQEMEGEFLALDLEGGTLTARFPVQEKFFNPYHTLQGGIVAAAADNTLGPLSVLVAPPNMTRRMEITYARPVTADVGQITVKARFLERNESLLYFRADLYDPVGQRLARVKATHWIMAGPPGGR